MEEAVFIASSYLCEEDLRISLIVMFKFCPIPLLRGNSQTLLAVESSIIRLRKQQLSNPSINRDAVFYTVFSKFKNPEVSDP